jgi:hypothetical protein
MEFRVGLRKIEARGKLPYKIVYSAALGTTAHTGRSVITHGNGVHFGAPPTPKDASRLAVKQVSLISAARIPPLPALSAGSHPATCSRRPRRPA